MFIVVLVGVEERIAFIMLVFKYSVAVSISFFVFSKIEAEVGFETSFRQFYS